MELIGTSRGTEATARTHVLKTTEELLLSRSQSLELLEISLWLEEKKLNSFITSTPMETCTSGHTMEATQTTLKLEAQVFWTSSWISGTNPPSPLAPLKAVPGKLSTTPHQVKSRTGFLVNLEFLPSVQKLVLQTTSPSSGSFHTERSSPISLTKT